ncbi:MAG: helix-turn-helix transcriptional regulator [Candidatus Korobacteraceae bacterium]|jgi:DNA-binding XRE family transcriptional regulator
MAYANSEYAIYECGSQEILLKMAGKSKVDLTAVGSRIKRLRGTILQEELATHLNVSQGHLSKIERGKIAPSLEMLVLLSVRFHKTIDWILRGEES